MMSQTKAEQEKHRLLSESRLRKSPAICHIKRLERELTSAKSEKARIFGIMVARGDEIEELKRALAVRKASETWVIDELDLWLTQDYEDWVSKCVSDIAALGEELRTHDKGEEVVNQQEEPK